MQRIRSSRLLWFATLASCFWLCSALLYQKTRTNFGPETAEYPGNTVQQHDYPFVLKKAPKIRFVLKQYLELSPIYPTTFQFYPQDFLWAIKVNGHEVEAGGLPLSSASLEGRSINLAPYLHPGLNELDLDMEVKWGEASLRICVSPWDRYSLLLLALVASATYCTITLFFQFFRLNASKAEELTLLAGILLRYVYLISTPYFVRSFDFWGHVDYLDYVVQNFKLPPLHSNWESYQPPLYYFLVGGITKLFLFIGTPWDQRYAVWQGMSLAFSIGTLFAGIWSSNTLYGGDKRRRLYLQTVLAVAPPLVFNSARISNDSLLALLEYLWLASLLHYWRRPSPTSWISLSFVLAMCLLTKANALILILITGVCLLLDRRVDTCRKTFQLGGLLVISLGLAGGYYLPRAIHEKAIDTFVVGNLQALNPESRIDGVFVKSIIFNPFKVVRYPLDEPWGPRHDYFLEVLFKTMLLGSWIKGSSYKLIARFIMLVDLFLIPFFLLGFAKALKEWHPYKWPMLLTLVVVFETQWIFLEVAPFLATQDFRYSVILVVPIVHYFLQGVEICSVRLQVIGDFTLRLGILNSAIYLIALSFNS